MPKAAREGAHRPLVSRRVPKRPGVVPQGLIIDQPGPTLYVSGQLPLQAGTGKPLMGEGGKQIELLLSNLVNLLKDAEFETAHAVRLTVYLKDLAHEAVLLSALPKFFVDGNFPTVTVVQVAGLPEGVAAALDAVAIRPPTGDSYEA
jgi:2-iminobutanoate/2-iminopropanoate deaminase